MKLRYNFFNRNTIDVAKDLLGKVLVVNDSRGIITETEAYRGADDEASHAYRGITKRSGIMFGRAGYSYVYMIYGMYHCFNIVTEEVGQPGAVLIRGLRTPNIYLNGPGKVCRYLSIKKDLNGIDLTESDIIYLLYGNTSLSEYSITGRIGIKKAVDKPWRFIVHESS